jgi:lipoyl-dependent peroxiredoxin subunit C
MFTIGDKLPEVYLKATVSNDLKDAFADVPNKSYPGK